MGKVERKSLFFPQLFKANPENPSFLNWHLYFLASNARKLKIQTQSTVAMARYNFDKFGACMIQTRVPIKSISRRVACY